MSSSWILSFRTLTIAVCLMFLGIVSKRLFSSSVSKVATKMPLAPVIALSHGGGPMPLFGDETQASITRSLKERIPKLLQLNTPSAPRAIVLITAHWSTSTPSISSAASPSLLYDYYGFPPEAYELSYPASGSPEIAERVRKAFDEEGLKPKLDAHRDWDHGVFVPMMLVNPEANVPILQVSVLKSEDPELHLRMGRALRQLREDNIAIVGSGFASFHNLRLMLPLMRSGKGAEGIFKAKSDAWNDAVTQGVLAEKEEDRWETMKNWRGFPSADEMHPPRGGEHFMPLLVCAGAAGDGEKGFRYKDDFVGVDIWTYYWGAHEVA